MIKFFRKIRLRLLSEYPSDQGSRAGKFSKYLLYALGEIILVVIGILIALQINNWNENRKKLRLKASYERSLIDDLALDTLMLGKLIDENYKILGSIERQQSRFLGPETPIDTLISIARNEFDPTFNILYKYNRNTLNTLIASGNIDLFSKEVNQMLMNLISIQDRERENAQFYSQVYSNKVSRFSDDYPVSRRSNSKIFNYIWQNYDERDLASRFISLTDIKGFAHYSITKELEQIKAETTAILERLDNDK